METSKWWWDFASRKFIVFGIGTGLLCFSKITENTWLYLALAFIGTNLVQKYIEKGKE